MLLWYIENKVVNTSVVGDEMVLSRTRCMVGTCHRPQLVAVAGGPSILGRLVRGVQVDDGLVVGEGHPMELQQSPHVCLSRWSTATGRIVVTLVDSNGTADARVGSWAFLG